MFQEREIFRFGDFELDEAQGRLLRGGHPVEVRATPLRLLRYLVRHPQRVIPKEELLGRVWSDASVSDAALATALKQLRQLLGEPGSRALKTLRGRGVCFEAAVDRRAAPGLVHLGGASPLVGRQAVLGRLSAALGAAAAGSGATLLLRGEAGIGKTRIVREIADRARGRGFQVYETWCEEGEGPPAYWPWIRLVRANLDAVDTVDTAALAAAFGPGLADLVRVVPELRERLDASLYDTLPPPGAQFRLQDGIARFAAVIARRRPMLIVFEDLHWADLLSLRIVQFMAREASNAPILFVATYRSEELEANQTLVDTVAALVRTPGHETLDVRGLGLEDVAALQQLVAPGLTTLPPRALWTRTGGNPLYVTELLRWAQERGSGPGAAPEQEIPPAVEAVLARRVQRLSPDAREALHVAALLGTRFDPRVVAAVVASPRTALVERLEEATRAGILVRDGAVATRYAFGHELMRDVVRAGLSTGSRIDLHRRIADALQALHPDDPQGLSEIALHALAAARGGGSAVRALECASRAAGVARARLAYEEAAAQLENALEALDLMGLRDDDRRCDLLLDLAEARAWVSPFEAVREAAHRAAELARDLGDAGRLARAVDAYVDEPVAGVPDFESIELLKEAVGALEPRDSLLRVRMLAHLAQHLRAAGESHRAAESLREARERAQRVGDPMLTAFVLEARAKFSWEDGPPEILLGLGTELLKCAEAARLPESALEGQILRLHAFLDLGDSARADREFAAIVRRIERSRLLRHEWVLPAYRGCRALLEGRFAEAEELAHEALRLKRRTGSRSAEMLFGAQMFSIRRDQGRLEEFEGALRQLGDDLGEAGQQVFRIGFAWVMAELGRCEEARAEFERTAGRGFEPFLNQPGWLNLLCQLGEVCATLGDAERAAELYALLLPRANQNLLVEVHVLWGPVSAVLGRLATARRRWHEAETHFEHATHRLLALGARPLLARNQIEHASMLLDRDDPGDRKRAAEMVTPALETARRLGLAGLLARGERLLRAASIRALPDRRRDDRRRRA